MKNKNQNAIALPRKSDPALWARISGQSEALASDKAFVAKLKAATPPGQRPRDLLHEYLRFAYLALSGSGSSTPSETVDGAWHAHILCTRSYAAFCKAIGRTLHHDPGTGASEEREGFGSAYRATWVRYRAEFGEPPAAFWPRPAGMPKATPANERTQGVREIPIFNALAWTVACGAIPGWVTYHVSGIWQVSAIMAGVMALVGIAVYASMVEIGAASQPSAGAARRKDSSNSSCGGDATPAILMASMSGDGGSSGGDGGDGGGSSCGGGGCGS